MPNQVTILKATGEREPFNRLKLLASLHKSGASPSISENVVDHIEKELVNEMTTEDIYKHAFAILSASKTPAAGRYSLRRSLAALGPSGYPFEKFVAEIFKRQGLETMTGQIIRGSCATHEIDVVAWNNEKLIFVEAKFHNEYYLKSDLKVALYIKARWDDLKEIKHSFGHSFGAKRSMDEGWLVTNTKFTSSAIEYSKCTNVKLVGWNYPEKGNLQNMIEAAGLHPITCLTSLLSNEKQELLRQGVVLCKNIRSENVLKNIGVPTERIAVIMKESDMLCPV